MKFIMPLLILLMVIPSASAFTPDVSCSSGYYSELYINDSVVVWNNSFVCSTGECARNGLECDNPATPEIFMPIGIAFAIMAFVFVYLAQKLDREHAPLQFMFMIFALLYMLYDSFVLSQFAEMTMNSLADVMLLGYQLGIWTIIFMILYFFYMVIKNIFRSLESKKLEGRPFKWFGS